MNFTRYLRPIAVSVISTTLVVFAPMLTTKIIYMSPHVISIFIILEAALFSSAAIGSLKHLGQLNSSVAAILGFLILCVSMIFANTLGAAFAKEFQKSSMDPTSINFTFAGMVWVYFIGRIGGTCADILVNCFIANWELSKLWKSE